MHLVVTIYLVIIKSKSYKCCNYVCYKKKKNFTTFIANLIKLIIPICTLKLYCFIDLHVFYYGINF